MAKWATLGDVTETVVTVTEEDLLEADAFVESLLREKGIDPALVEGNEMLRLLAVYFATYRALVREAAHEDSVLLEKAKFYEKLYKEKVRQVSPASLGISSSSGSASVEIGRG